jgi:hypothetical protein
MTPNPPAIYIFLGPTLPLAEAQSILDAIYLPPVSQGDVLGIMAEKPVAIGIIDGYFERIPAVWHKEILWAMKHGIHVFGSASMGALRAAELAAFGMEGVGEIYEHYQSGLLMDDDEVAVAHASPEDSFMLLSTAMADIRATLQKAQMEAVISSETQARLIAIAKSLYYPQRIYPRILAVAKEQGADSGEVLALETWLPQNQFSQKRADALAMLTLMRERFSNPVPPKQTLYAFQYVQLWDFALQEHFSESKTQ